jgi:hypothetical protein
VLRILGRHDEVVRIYEEQAQGAEARGSHYRILGMRDRILMGDTAGALALVDSARTQPLTAFRARAGTSRARPSTTAPTSSPSWAAGTRPWPCSGRP